jgi:D-alanyl-D-alanine carboxypeptidase/D-alanyl-D-alanine-endopeptidase (penicillin-binding protein 4)
MRLLGLMLSLLLAYNSFAQSLPAKIENAYKHFEADPQMRYGIASLTVLNAQTGETLFSANGNTGLASASTLKTVTALTAFHLLGKDFTWETSLGYNGTIQAGGILEGNVIITGSGDPSLGSERYEETKPELLLQRWTHALKQAGIKEIKGSIIADDHLFGTQTLPGGWTWQDMGNYYGAGPSSLTWRENQFGLVFKPGRVGEKAELLYSEPQMSYLKIINEVTTGRPGTGDNVYAYSAPYSEIIYVRGTYGADLRKTIMASIPDPALDLAHRVLYELRSAGIKVDKDAVTSRILESNGLPFTPPVKILAVHTSPTLDRIVYWFNRRSINLFGEHLIKTIAWKQGVDIRTPDGVKLMKDFWKAKIGIDTDAMNVYDGSGLSPSNRITTQAMAQILQSVKNEPWFDSFYESLPLYNNMKMKSGSISDVIAYTGYQTSSSGVPLVFSFIVNNYSGSSSALRQKLFKVLDVLK